MSGKVLRLSHEVWQQVQDELVRQVESDVRKYLDSWYKNKYRNEYKYNRQEHFKDLRKEIKRQGGVISSQKVEIRGLRQRLAEAGLPPKPPPKMPRVDEFNNLKARAERLDREVEQLREENQHLMACIRDGQAALLARDTRLLELERTGVAASRSLN